MGGQAIEGKPIFFQEWINDFSYEYWNIYSYK